MENNILKVLEEIRDLQKETVENQRQALFRNEQIMKGTGKYRKFNFVFLILLIIFFIFQIVKLYSM